MRIGTAAEQDGTDVDRGGSRTVAALIHCEGRSALGCPIIEALDGRVGIE